MEEYSSSDSNISTDSLDMEFKKKRTIKKKILDENVDTILVPFYEKDVLIKVPKGKNLKNGTMKTRNTVDKLKQESLPVKNYLVNKDARKAKHTSYLEMFRKQFAPTQPDNTRQADNDIRSVSPEFGDTERESFREEVNNPSTDFLNTESYNEIYYDKLINQEINNFLEQAYEEQLQFSNDIRTNSPDIDDNNLKSISDVSQPRRNMRRATVQPIASIKLGGLGPDMENIRPRLERARSLQRYSEKVRMENRVRIYKKSVQEEIEKKAEKELSVKRQESARSKERKSNENSFLVNKNTPVKSSPMFRKFCNSKSKSANVKQARQRNEVNEKLNIKNHVLNIDKNKALKKVDVCNKERIKSCDTKINDKDPIIGQVNVDVPIPPVQISFLVNMGGLRPSSALRTLEAKHRMYQEKVKAFTINKNNEDDGHSNN